MFSFLLRRLLLVVPQMIGVSFLTYLLIDLAPGNYCDKLLENPNVSADELHRCQQFYGFDQPVLVRYGRWLAGAVHGDFGPSFGYGQPVFDLIRGRLVNTLTLSLSALLVGWTVALLLGVTSGVRPYSWIDKACGLLAYAGLSVPAVFLSLLMLLFAYQTKLFPIGDVVSSFHDQLSPLGKLQDRVWHLALPCFVLAVTSMAGYMRQMRSSMIETLSQDFVRTARAKGLSEGAVVYRHAFVNAVNPLITLFGYSIGFLLNGSFLVEVVMNWPGMARLTVDAIYKQDEPLVLAAVVVATSLIVAGNLVADLLLAAADPRIRLEKG